MNVAYGCPRVGSGLSLTLTRPDWIGWTENKPVADRTLGSSPTERVGASGLKHNNISKPRTKKLKSKPKTPEQHLYKF